MKKNLAIIFALVCIAFFCSYDIPKGWFRAGSCPDKYDMGVDKGAGESGKNAATIKSIGRRIHGFGTLMQSILPDKYLGKKIMLSGYMKSENVANWAGFWLRVDQKGSNTPLSFDNMADRPVKGTTGWTKFEIVLDVPTNASGIAYGALLSGTGQIWFDDIIIGPTGQDARTTGTTTEMMKTPRNLDFEE